MSEKTISNDLLIPNNRDYYLIIDTNKSIIIFINGQLSDSITIADMSLTLFIASCGHKRRFYNQLAVIFMISIKFMSIN